MECKVCIENKNYIVYKDGRVYSILKNKFLKPVKRKDGYLQVFLSKKPFYLHRLIANNFIYRPINLIQINHKDKDKTNNSADNLEWCDNSYNQIHKHFGKKRGVSYHKHNNKYRVTLKGKHIAYVDSLEEGYDLFFNKFKEFYGKEPW